MILYLKKPFQMLIHNKPLTPGIFTHHFGESRARSEALCYPLQGIVSEQFAAV
jgi:hypothetical protein